REFKETVHARIRQNGKYRKEPSGKAWRLSWPETSIRERRFCATTFTRHSPSPRSCSSGTLWVAAESSAKVGGRCTHESLEGAAERRLGLLTQPCGDHRNRQALVAKPFAGQVHAPPCDVAGGRHAQDGREALRELRTRLVRGCRQRHDRPGLVWTAVKRGQRSTDLRIAYRTHPAGRFISLRLCPG